MQGWILFIVLCLLLAAMTAGGAFSRRLRDDLEPIQPPADPEPPEIPCRLCGRPAEPYTANRDNPPLCAHCLRRIIMGAIERRASELISLPLDAGGSSLVCALCNKSGHRRFFYVPEAPGPVCGYCVNRRFHQRAT